MEGANNLPGNHKCHICSRFYERPDHLARHLKSHENERSHRCTECGKGFNRADLLNRHRAAHAKALGATFRRRTNRACEACIKAKAKCDDGRPCKRCCLKDTECRGSGEAGSSYAAESVSDEPEILDMRHGSFGFDARSSLPRDTSLLSGDQMLDRYAQPPSTPGGGNLPPDSRRRVDRQSNQEPAASGMLEDVSLASIFNTAAKTGVGTSPFHEAAGVSFDPAMNHVVDFGFSDFFDSILASGNAFGNPNQAMVLPDLSDFTQNQAFEAADFDLSFLASGLTRPPTPQAQQQLDHATPDPENTALHSDGQLRFEVFKNSPWSWNHWIPPANHHAFSGQEEINIQADHVNTADHQLVSPSGLRVAHTDLDHAARDRMIRVVTKAGSERLTMTSFPSLELLEDLIDVFLLQHNSAVDSFIHVGSFDAKDTCTELLLAKVASGTTFIALAPVWRMGLVIQEVVRLAVAMLFESDNASTRELQVLIAFMLWLDVGVWCGFRRKTEIALSFLQPLATMLMWSHAFTSLRYDHEAPQAEDVNDLLEQKWKQWIQQESLKRLVFHVFVHDFQVAIANMKNPLLSASQMTLPLPASKELWLAPNAHAWRNTYLRLAPQGGIQLPSAAQFFRDSSLVESMNSAVDRSLCMLASVHRLGHEVWAYRQSSRLLQNWGEHSHRDRWLAHQATQKYLLEDLSMIQAHCEAHQVSSGILLSIELLMMLLYVDLEDIMIFSGKAGEEGARQVVPRIRAWTAEADSRSAIHHAGQVFRLANTFEHTSLRDFYVVALYQAALTLWVYGMVTKGASRRNGVQNTRLTTPPMEPSQQHVSPESFTEVVLNNEDSRQSKAFKLLGQGTPGIKDLRSFFVPLTNSRGVMAIAEAILRGNFPQNQHGLPPLVENLARLMNELGKLSSKD